MQERQFNIFASTSILSKLIQGSKPEFELYAYDAQGAEMKAPKKTKTVVTKDGKETTQEVEPEVEQTFFQKYWYHMIVGFMIL